MSAPLGDIPFNRREVRVLKQVEHAHPVARRIMVVLLTEHREYQERCIECDTEFPCRPLSVVLETILEEDE